MPETSSDVDRKRGTLLGLAVGDALGAAIEFKPPPTSSSRLAGAPDPATPFPRDLVEPSGMVFTWL
ncbi:MAG: hypothetical protein ACOX1P_03495 [Thermoguttaceae bacterium]|jgi:hypothetical protein